MNTKNHVLMGKTPPLKIISKNSSFLKMLLRGVPFELLYDVISKMGQVEKAEFEEDGYTRKLNTDGNFIGRRVIDFNQYRIIADRIDSQHIAIVSAYDKTKKDENIGFRVQKLTSELMQMVTRNLTAGDITTLKHIKEYK